MSSAVLGTSCGRCGRSLRESSDAHDCDGQLIANAIADTDARSFRVGRIVNEARVPAGRVIQWAQANGHEIVGDPSAPESLVVHLRAEGETAAPTPEQDPVAQRVASAGAPLEVVGLMLDRIRESGREIGQLEVTLELLHARLGPLASPAIAEVVVRLLRLHDIGPDYDSLSTDEQSCGTREQLSALLDWIHQRGNGRQDETSGT